MNTYLKFKLYLLIFALFSILSIAAYAESEWLIDSIDKLEKWTLDSRMLQYEIKNGKCEFTLTGDEPYISYSVPAGNESDFSQYKNVALRANCDVEGCIVKIVVNNIHGEKYETTSELNGDGEWHDYVTEFSAKGKVSSVKVYFISEKYAESYVHVVFDRIGFFENAEKAQYFLDRTIVSLKEKDEIIYPTGNGPFKWDFSESSAINVWNYFADHIRELGMLKLAPLDGSTAKMEIAFEGNQFASGEYRFFALRYKSLSEHNVARINFKTSKFTDGSEYFVLKNDGTWHNLILDMSKYATRKWSGYVTKVELLLPHEKSSADDIVYIERMGFFDSYNNASQYLIENAERDDYKKEKVFKGTNYKIIVPAGAMNEAYEEKDIVADFSAASKASNVVMLNGAPLPLSDISESGLAVYCAKQKGIYSIGTYEKKYNDTDGHWAKEYIDYVSARTLFSGTTQDTFSPEITITRGMLVTVLGRMHGVDTDAVGTKSGYSDVPSNEYYAPYIKWIKDNAIFPVSGDKFYPNRPISRSEMAFVIANYTDFCGFEIQSYETSNKFGDISGCTEDVQKAIEKIQSIGIINGKSSTVFDPDGILTRAEASAVMTRLIKSVLGVFYGNNNYKNSGIRIGAYANFDTDTLNEALLYAYYSAGFNSMLLSNEVAYGDKRDFVLGYCDRHGINAVLPVESDTSSLSDVAEYSAHPSFCGNLAADEPGSEEFDVIAEFSKAYSEKNSGKKLVANLLPLYSSEAQLEYGKLASYPDYYDTSAKLYKSYCEEYVQKVETDVIMTNIFPFTSAGMYKRYIEAVAVTAGVAKKNDKEFWCMIQADNIHNTKEHFMRQYYTLLSFGCKNIILWLWNDGLCDEYGNYTASYDSVKKANYEIKPVIEKLSEYTYLYTALFNKSLHSEIYGIKKSPVEIEVKNSKPPVIIGAFENGVDKAYLLFNASENTYAEIELHLPDSSKEFETFGGSVTSEIVKNGDIVSIKLEAGQGIVVSF